MIKTNKICFHDRFKVLKNFNVLRQGKEYMIIGFGGLKLEGLNKEVWIVKQIRTEEAREFPIFKDTANKLIEDKVIQKL